MKRLLSLLTAAALVLSLVPAEALAAETGACEHHIQHDANCGYNEAVPESPCTHVHTQECYSSATQCVHAHTEQCYSDGVLPAEGEEKTADACAHVCSAETGCVTTALDCKHQHDETCGYAPATAGTPCTFVCEICSAAANEPAKCTCESKCSEGLVNGECPVCTAAPGSCTGKEPEPPAPVCNCTAKCAEDAANGECPVCGAVGADLSACRGKEPEQPQVITITEWSWVVTADTPKLADGKLYLPSAITEANLAGITDTLPKNIEANGQSIPVSWTYDWNTQTFTATLPAGYALAESAAPLTLEAVDMGAGTLEKDPVGYIDENNQQQTCTTYTLVTGNDNAWNDGWYVVKGDVTIGQRVTVSGDVKLILTDGCQLTASNGIGINVGGSLTITAQTKDPNTMGSLTATYGDTGAAIGGDDEQFACSIIINGGRITAERTNSSMRGGAGIGGISQTYSAEPSNGSIIINDGIVTATGSLWDPGIGIGGNNGSSVTITINGGTVNATGGPAGGAGIGTRENSTSGFAITINGGNITATGGLDGGAGIGSGFDRYANSKEGSIIITGGTVNAIGGNGGAGIGSGLGNKDSRSTVTITGGDITATGGSNGAGIGGAGCTLSGNCGNVIQASSISADTTNFNGIVYSGTTYQVYGDVTLTESLEIKAGETLNVPNGASLTIPAPSMITGGGSVSLSGLLKMEPEGPEDISAPEKIAYTDGNLTQAILDAVSISAEKEVTLAGQQVTVHLISDGWTKSLKEGTAVSTGTYTVQFTKNGKTIEKTITVKQSGSSLTGEVNTDKTKYTYGETITITAKPTATGVAAFSLTPPAENQMAVYTQDGTQISEAVNPDSKGIYTMTLDSTKLGAGTHTLMVKFTGNDNLAATSQEITVIINKADPTVSIPTGLTAVIGSTLKDVTLPSGWAWTAPDTDVRNAGENSFLAVFTPADIANYNTLEVSLTVSVSKPDLSSAKVTLGTALTYTGKDQTQTVKSVTLGGKTLTEDTDYTVTNNTGKDAGTYTLTITGKGNYTGTLKVSFPIAKAPLTITGVDVQSKTYDGTTAATVTGVSFKGLVNGEALAMGTDYTATADFDNASADTFKSVTGKVTLLSSTLGKNYVLSDASFLTSGDISAAASKLSFKVDRTKPVKGQYITFSVTPQIKGDNRSFLQRVLGINAPKVEFWANGTTKLGEVKVEEGKTSTFAYDTDKGGLKLGKNTITAEFTGDGNLKGCTESVVVYLHDSTTSAPTGDESNIQTWTAVLVVSAVALVGLGVGAVIYRKKKK